VKSPAIDYQRAYNTKLVEMRSIGLKYLLLVHILICALQHATAQQRQQHVILISLDGFRWDYVEKFQPPHLTAFAQGGASAEAMIPSFPSKTFPNHYSIATGMRPETHGLVNNSFYDPVKDKVFEISDREVVQDGYWYGGTPIWVLAEQNGITSASYFFVGTEAPVKGVQPTYFYNYDGAVSNMKRIEQVFEWLKMPEEKRPKLITLYFSDMDDVGHRFGPDNTQEISQKLLELDKELGILFEGLKDFDLDINIVLVSDHGMTNVKRENLLDLDRISEGIAGKVVNNGALAHVYLDDLGQKAEVKKLLESRANHFAVVDVEDRDHYVNIDAYRNRFGDLLILPELGFYLATASGMINYQKRSAMFRTNVYGEHGYSPDYKDMHGVFYANGPLIQKGITVPAFENIHVYPLLAALLDLPLAEEVEGKLEVLSPILIDSNGEEKNRK
jgi:predicted AlkP superfamily pyrophosphatase or phosphodiesterase